MNNHKNNIEQNINIATASAKTGQALYISTLRAISLALLGLLMLSFLSATAFAEEEKAKKAEDYNYIIADIRSVGEYEDGHFEKAVNVPPERVEEFFSAREIPEDTIVLLHCRTGNRSGRAYQKIKALGIKNIYDVGGLSEMKALYPKLSQDKILKIEPLPSKG